MKKMKMLSVMLVSIVSLTSCMKPVRVDPIKEIEPNETAFIIPLEDGTEDQKQLESVEYLKAKQVAAKRIIVPQRFRETGRFGWQGEWIPTVRVLTVDRTPITRSWIYNPKEYDKDNTSSTRTFGVESKDSIGFDVGVNVSAYIDEKDTATYLYYYRGNDLASIMDQNVREKVHTILSTEFGNMNLTECKEGKGKMTTLLKEQVTAHFKEFGITITSIGLAEGLTFEQPEIQKAINDAYVAEMLVEQKKQEVLQQEQINQKLLSEAKGQKAQAVEFEAASEIRKKLVDIEIQMIKANALKAAIEKWDGKTPTMMTGDATNLLLQLNK